MLAKLSGPMLAPVSGAAPRRLVVLLHGYGSNGNDLIGLAPAWQPILPDALFLAPNAHQGVPGYPSGYQWFTPGMSDDARIARQTGLIAAAPVLIEFLNQLWAQTGLTAGDTILAGFSQGAMMALHVGLSLPQPLLGVIGFSGSFEPPADFGQPQLPKPPVCIVHGDMDQIVPCALSEAANAALVGAGYDVRLHISPGASHTIAPDGLAFASDFIAEVAQIPGAHKG